MELSVNTIYKSREYISSSSIIKFFDFRTEKI